MDHLWSCASKRPDPDDPLQEGTRKHSNNNADEDDGNALIRFALCAIRTPSRTNTISLSTDGRSTTVKSKCLGSNSGRVTGSGTSTSCNRQFFPLPPLALLPCAERQADPSPPSSDDEKPTRGSVKRGDDSGSGTAAAVAGVSWPRAGRGVEAISDRYEVLAVLGRGTFGRILLAECRTTGRKMALKELPKTTTKLTDFLREFNYGRQMSTCSSSSTSSTSPSSSATSSSAANGAGHPAIVLTYDDAFETPTTYVFAQEYACGGDLLAAVAPPNRGGLGETRTKRVARQIGSALAYLHERRIVHRDVKPENILVYDGPPTTCRRVKLGDFGVARRAGTLVCRLCPGTAYTAPEVAGRDTGRTYRVDPATDVWAFGVVMFALLTGNFPWRLARVDAEDRLFSEFVIWQERRRVFQTTMAEQRNLQRQRSSSVDSRGDARRSPTPRGGSPSRRVVGGRSASRVSESGGGSDRMPDPWSKFAEPFIELIHRLLDIRAERRMAISSIDEYIRPDLPWLVRARPSVSAVSSRVAVPDAGTESAGGETTKISTTSKELVPGKRLSHRHRQSGGTAVHSGTIANHHGADELKSKSRNGHVRSALNEQSHRRHAINSVRFVDEKGVNGSDEAATRAERKVTDWLFGAGTSNGVSIQQITTPVIT